MISGTNSDGHQFGRIGQLYQYLEPGQDNWSDLAVLTIMRVNWLDLAVLSEDRTQLDGFWSLGPCRD